MNSELNAMSIPMNWRLELDWIELELDLDWIGNPMNKIIVHKNVTNEYIFVYDYKCQCLLSQHDLSRLLKIMN